MLSVSAPEDGGGRDSLGDKAEDGDEEKPETKVPHARKHRTEAGYPLERLF